MKTKILFLLIALATYSLNAITILNDPITNATNTSFTEQLKGVYDGSDEFGYTFILTLDDGEGVIFTFNKIEPSISETYDLKSEDLVGKTFLISFEMVPLKDASGNEVETNIYTITDLEAI